MERIVEFVYYNIFIFVFHIILHIIIYFVFRIRFENVFASPKVDDSEIDQNLLDEEPCCST